MKTLFQIEPAYAAALRAAGLDSFDAIMNMPGGPPASKHQHRETVPVEIEIDGAIKKFFLKRVFKVPPKHAIWPLFRGQPNISQPRNEWNILAKLYAAGIPAMQRVAYGERRTTGKPTAAFILIESVDMEHTLAHWMTGGPSASLCLDRKTRYRLMSHVGRIVGRLNAHNIYWPDMHAKHIFAAPLNHQWRLRLIDVERMQSLPAPPAFVQVLPFKNMDLIRLRESLLPMQLPYREFLYFVSGYSQEYAAAKKLTRDQIRWFGDPRHSYQIMEHRPRWNNSCVLYRTQCFNGTVEFRVDSEFSDLLAVTNLSSMDTVFAFQSERTLAKPGLGPHRSRAEFSVIDCNGQLRRYYLKRYQHTPASERLRHIVESNPKRSAAWRERHFIKRLGEIGIPTMRVIAYGEEMRGIIEKRSFLITEEVSGESLEKLVARVCNGEETLPAHPERVDIIHQLALLARMMHWRRLFHRDLYLSHVFLCRNPDGKPVLHLIDLARMIEKPWRTERWRIKDLAALEYSSPYPLITRTDRIRFLKSYLDPGMLHRTAGREAHKQSLRYYIGPVVERARRIARHDDARKRERDTKS
jgi:tRNA A-37 threonylcarbamoyl transferase component Bud32